MQAERLEVGPVVPLPDPEFRLPREKPLPKKKELTKWQKYAQEKGIQNRKRDRMVWDEASQSVSLDPSVGRGSRCCRSHGHLRPATL